MAKKVLIVDDSALVRKQLRGIIETLEFDIDIAKNGQEAVDMATSEQYDVITMDINMPVMDGLEAVKQIMSKNPTAILMVSSLTTEEADTTIKALELGAVDYIPKPGTMNVGKAQNAELIVEKIKELSRIPRRRLQRLTRTPMLRERRSVKQENNNLSSLDIEKVVLIGASTGGPGLIEQICAAIPANYKYPVCVVQHMPAQFTKAFATRLDRASALKVQETESNMELLPSNIYVARGGVHMNFAKKTSGKIVIREDTHKGDNHFQPSVDDMMLSALKVFNAEQIVAVLLTGIGDDGAEGMVKIKKAGGYTIGESESSAIVYGMPKVAYDNGGVSEQLDFKMIKQKIASLK